VHNFNVSGFSIPSPCEFIGCIEDFRIFTEPGVHNVALSSAVFFTHVSLYFLGGCGKIYDEIGVAHMGKREIRNPFWFVNKKERIHLVDLGIGGRVNTKTDLKNMSEERGMA
jgi:hypothetical protein